MNTKIWNAISIVEDLRVQGRTTYPLSLILLVTLYAIIGGGGDDWERIEDYANNYREDLLRMHEKLSGTALNIARMPSPDTFNRVFQIIDPMGFKSACKAFVRAVYKGITGKDIAIDGKTPQGVKWVGSSSPAHIVSAYCPAHQFVVDYLKSEEKGGELALMLALLELLTLEERTVAIDTAGTHTDVVEKIQSQGGHFVLTVKGYQKNLLRLSGIGSVRTGGVRYRPMRRWAREVYRKSVGSTRTEAPHYITDLPDPKRINGAIRRHWGERE